MTDMPEFRWPSHEAPFGTCPECGEQIHVATGGDGDVIMSVGTCRACGVTTVWDRVDLGGQS